MKRYTYLDKETGKKVYSDKPLKGARYQLVSQLRDVKMKSREAHTT